MLNNPLTKAVYDLTISAFLSMFAELFKCANLGFVDITVFNTVKSLANTKAPILFDALSPQYIAEAQKDWAAFDIKAHQKCLDFIKDHLQD